MPKLKIAFEQRKVNNPLQTKHSRRRDEYQALMKNVSLEEISDAIDQEFKVIDKNLDNTDCAINLLGVAEQIDEPTETELKLLQIAQSLTAPTAELDLVREAPAMEALSQTNFKLSIEALQERLVLTQESILSGMADIWTAFKAFLSKIGFKLRSYNSQLSKLRSILTNVRLRSTKNSINVELKASPLMYIGDGEGRMIKPLVSTQSVAEGLSSYCTHYELFATACANAIYTYSSRYGSTFLTLFNRQAREELFYDELNQFKESFFDAVINDAKLEIKERKGLVTMTRSPVGICGSFFGVTSPNEVISKSTAIDAVLRSFNEYSIEVDNVNFNYQQSGKTKVLSVNLTDVENMLNCLESTMAMLDNLANDRLYENIQDLEKFVDFSIPEARYDDDTGTQTTTSKLEQSLTVAQIAFKKTNAVARLQVMQAHVVIDGFRAVFDGLIDKLDTVIPFCYEALNKKEWYEQELGM